MTHAPWPKLSETLPHERRPDACQACGRRHDDGADIVQWREHDDRDRPTDTHVALCHECGERLIESHPRLYGAEPHNRPTPGHMLCCAPCPHRSALCCTHPLLKANGGPGLPICASNPTIVFLDGVRNGRRCGGHVVSYKAPPVCVARQDEVKAGFPALAEEG